MTAWVRMGRGESWQDDAQRRGGHQRKMESQCGELVDGEFRVPSEERDSAA